MKHADRPLHLIPRERFVPEPEPVNPRPHDFAAQQLTVINLVTGERRELDPRAWPEYRKRP